MDPKIQGSEILLVTAGLYRVIELANAAGIPTALLRRPGVLEARLEHATGKDKLSAPTMIAEGFGELCDQLELVRSGSFSRREI